MRWSAAALAFAIAAISAQAAFAAQLLDSRAVPYLNDAGRASYEAWLRTNLPRAVAIAPGGQIGVASDASANGLDGVRSNALRECATKGGKGCALYAENLDVVWPGQQSHAGVPPGPLIKTWNFAFVPDERFIWHGPAAARGLLVWGHSYGGPEKDNRGVQPQAHNRPLNNVGYDVVRFDREPMADTKDRAAGWLRDGLRKMRQLGYRSIIVGGESRGAWNSLQIMDTPNLADVIIAVSPAAHGAGESTSSSAQVYELRGMMASAPSSQTRVAFIQFAGDPYMSNPDGRAAAMRDGSSKFGAFLLIDRPSGFAGHSASGTPEFGLRYGECLMHFALDPAPPASCSGTPP